MLYATTSLHYIGLTQSNVCLRLYNYFCGKCIYEEWYGACIIQSAIFQEILLKFNIISHLKKGYLITNDTYYCWHTWLYVPKFNLNIDVGKFMSMRALSSKGICVTMFSMPGTLEPSHLIRTDMDTKEELIIHKKNEKLYQKFTTKNNVFDDAETPGFVKRIFHETCNEDFCKRALTKPLDYLSSVI